jgi:hypothetical protein
MSEAGMEKVEPPLGAVGSVDIPHALLPRAADSELARRASAAADLVAGFGASGRLDGRFRLAVADLAKAVVGLEGMRACGLAPELAEQALPRLAEVLSLVERELDRAVPELEAERRDIEAARAPARRARKSRRPAPH